MVCDREVEILSIYYYGGIKMVEYVNNTSEKIKVQYRNANEIVWKTLNNGDKIEAYDIVYAQSYEASGLSPVEEVKEVVVEKKTTRKKTTRKRKK